jgi:hypothetical protein
MQTTTNDKKNNRGGGRWRRSVTIVATTVVLTAIIATAVVATGLTRSPLIIKGFIVSPHCSSLTMQAPLLSSFFSTTRVSLCPSSTVLMPLFSPASNDHEDKEDGQHNHILGVGRGASDREKRKPWAWPGGNRGSSGSKGDKNSCYVK